MGNCFIAGLMTCQLGHESYSVFGLYLIIISIFHFSEYLTIALVNPKSLSLNSFLINHSREYCLAAIGSWIEFSIECYLFSQMKTIKIISYFGLLLCLFGEVIRKLAMITAGSNFNHIIQSQKSDDHVLVTNGIYSISRHPSYLGWFWWSIGTQVIKLDNLFMQLINCFVYISVDSHQSNLHCLLCTCKLVIF